LLLAAAVHAETQPQTEAPPQQTPEGWAANYMRAADLAENCRAFLKMRRAGNRIGSPADAMKAGTCYGYVMAAFDAYEIEGDRVYFDEKMLKFCFPASVSTLKAEELTEIVAKFLNKKAEQRTLDGPSAVRRALADKFPCH
jgi:hypothetical protein